MKSIKNLLLLLSACGLLVSCEKRRSWDLPPNMLFLQVKKDGAPLPDSLLSSIKVFYWKDGKKVNRPAANLTDSTLISPGTRYLGDKFGGQGLLASFYIGPGYEYYFEFPDGDIGTLQVEADSLSAEEGRKHRCFCRNPFTQVRFNGKVAPETSDIKEPGGKPIFLLEK
jgi:hypothetical protein